MGKNPFFQSHPEPFGILEQVFFARFEHVVMLFGPWKIPKCLENGLLSGPKISKNGSKIHFSKGDHERFRMLNHFFFARFEPMSTLSPPQQGWTKVCSEQAYLHLTLACHTPQPQVCWLLGPLCRDGVDEVTYRCSPEQWEDTAKGGQWHLHWWYPSCGLRAGSVPARKEVDDVWAAPREEHRVEGVGGN